MLPKSRRQNVNISSRRPARAQNEEEQAAVDLIDQLTDFEDFRALLLPQLKQMIKDKRPTSEIIEAARPLLVAKLVSAAVLADDGGRAAQVAEKLLDRLEGKAVEKKEVSHRLGKLKDEELDAMLLTAIDEDDD
jgi:hypothetical protein